jgi:signal transduction histidine kinase
MMEFTHAKPDGIIDQLKQKFSHRISLKTGYENKIGITGLAIQTRRPQYAKNIHLGQWPNYYIEYHPETMCEFAIPLIAGEHVIGVLNVEHAVEGGLDEQDCQALDALAQQAVVAIQKTEQQELVIKRTTLASRYLGRELDRHTLNLKIGTIRNYVGALQNSLKKPLSRKGEMRARNALQRIEEAASELENLRERPLVTEVIDININELITKHQRALWTKENYRAVKCQLDLQLPDNLTVQANPHWLCEVIEILVDNAVKAMKASKVKHLTITTREVEREKGKWGDIILTDTGCGMSDETRSAFGKRPIEKSDIEGGMGIGVLMADYIIDTYQGKLWVEDTNPGGTTIIVRLPLDA